MLDLTKKYQTKDEHEVRGLIRNRAKGRIEGEVGLHGRWFALSWNYDGVAQNPDLDLIEVPESVVYPISPEHPSHTPTPKPAKPDLDQDLAAHWLETVAIELRQAMKSYPTFASDHEGYAVLKEEVDELWDAIKLKQTALGRGTQIEDQCVQVAAMAIRIVLDRRARNRSKQEGGSYE
jgi:hypothetical protein